MRAEGVEFHPNSHVGVTVPVARLMKDYDAVVLAIGAEAPRDLPVPGRDSNGIHFAMEFLDPAESAHRRREGRRARISSPPASMCW